MATFDRAAQTALRLIRKSGAKAMLVRKVEAEQGSAPGNFDPVSQTVLAPPPDLTPLTFPILVVLVPAGSPRSPWARGDSSAKGTLEVKRAATLYIAQAGLLITPKNGDTVEGLVNGPWTLVDTKVYDPAQDGAVVTIAYAEL